ncbi:hypothetical protein BOTBODRAFT_191890 [Botryobasidium botryosum FD-172 SS1]|uniref:CUE domain-containing protein n=1 Tax=Botryobasidium botryosum (strain FD-172 SS1) TaxID=930990 RepID=A0A067LYF1_BOTB1|nr:hypothetical protein BOTBODRAFT_191890 [Botryobasidium botryosum FD-172 SS1]
MSFHNAGVAKGLMLAVGVASLLTSLLDIKYYFHLQLVPHMSHHHQYWRLLVHHFTFSNSSELFIGEILLYNIAVNTERMFGSLKFGSFVVVSLLLSTVLSFASLLALHRFEMNVIPSGPIALIFSILYQHYRIVPSSYTYRISSISISNKAPMYFLALQLAIFQPPGSAVAAIVGLLVGLLYRSDIIGLKSYRIPHSVQRFASPILFPLIGSTRAAPRSSRAFPEERSQIRRDLEVITTALSARMGARGATAPASATTNGDAGAAETAGAAAAANQPSMMSQWVDELTGGGATPGGMRAPTEAEITQLVNMFPDIRREDVVTALQRSGSVEQAVETLLVSQT